MPQTESGIQIRPALKDGRIKGVGKCVISGTLRYSRCWRSLQPIHKPKLQSALVLDQATDMARLRSALTAITIIILMLARLMATMGRSGSLAECSSARARGSAAASDILAGAGVVKAGAAADSAAAGVVAALSAHADLTDAASAGAALKAVDLIMAACAAVEVSTVVAGSTAAAVGSTVVDRTVAAASMAEAADMVAAGMADTVKLS
jgi:hypothetical protein